MARIQRSLLTLQEAGIPVQFNGESDVPMPVTEQVLMDKLHHLETSNSELRSTFNEIYNKYMASELECHRLEEEVRDLTSQTTVMESQIAELERRAFETTSINTTASSSAGRVIVLSLSLLFSFSLNTFPLH